MPVIRSSVRSVLGLLSRTIVRAGSAGSRRCRTGTACRADRPRPSGPAGPVEVGELLAQAVGILEEVVDHQMGERGGCPEPLFPRGDRLVARVLEDVPGPPEHGRYLRILVTRPAPTVRPPSRIANRRPSSIAIGAINSTVHLRVVTRHAHLRTLRQRHRPRDIRRPEIELRPIIREERLVTTTLLLRQHIHLSLEIVCGVIDPGFANT